jgi:N-acetylated-alpha-linked acidic dipeptidase
MLRLIHVFLIGIVFSTGLLPVSSLTAQSGQSQERLKGFTSNGTVNQLALEQMLVDLHKPETYRRHLFELTREPNVAGTQGNRNVIDYMTRVMRDAAMQVDHYDYEVWLPEPGSVSVSITSPVEIRLPNQEVMLEEDPSTQDPKLVHGYHAYSGTGSVTAEVVYANYGRREDFQQLKELGVDVTGKVVIARFGGNFRGYKAKYAEEAGAAGLVIYSDPGTSAELPYPQGKGLNEHTIQRGSLLTMDYFGDPLTPFHPALPMNHPDTPERLGLDEVGFHTIPVAPLGFGAAIEILSRMKGPVAPEDWKGGLDVPYALTGGTDLMVNVTVDQPASLKEITNVIGTFKGSVYPDEWIIMGSHFDAWGHGATDPNSGTAMLLTLAESLGELTKQGYQPKRSVMIAHWDAEEFLIIGSSEWVEQLRDDLAASAVIYLNADMSVTGANFGSSAAPSLKLPIIEATKVVPHPDIQGSVYDQWLRDTTRTEPNIGSLGGGSDHVPFYMHAGVPSAGLSISSGVPVYHSNYDTFTYYERFLDPRFVYGPTLASVYGVVATRFADADVLPYDLMRYASDLKSHAENIAKMAAEHGFVADFAEFYVAVEELQIAAALAETRLKNLVARRSLTNEELRSLNSDLILLEKAFISEDGMPFGRWFQSLYAASDPFSGYASWMLPGVRFAVTEYPGTPLVDQEIDRLVKAVRQLKVKIETL